MYQLWGHSINLIDNKLYIIGGIGRNSYTSIIYELNLDDWKVRYIDMDD